MKVDLYKFENNKVIPVEPSLTPGKWDGQISWVDIYSNDRVKVADYLEQYDVLKTVRDVLVHPEKNPLPVTTDKYIVQNFVISNEKDFYKPDHFTLIIMKEMIICVFPYAHSFKRLHQPQSDQMKDHFDDLRFFFIHELVDRFIVENIVHLGEAKKRLHKMEEKLMTSPGDLTSSEVMKMRNDIGHLADIFEDQYVGFNILMSLFSHFNQHNVDNLKKFVESFKELNRMVVRLEEKAESFRYQFLLIHQEEASHKINVLTIIQAIFVPMTFIAGVYGMNFHYMPELTWKYGYFITIGLFVLVGVTAIYFFWKNGWFD
jgi:magnesium transporter